MLAAVKASEYGDPQVFLALVLVVLLRVFDEGLLFSAGSVVVVSLGGGVVAVVVVVSRGTIVATSCLRVSQVVHPSHWVVKAC